MNRMTKFAVAGCIGLTSLAIAPRFARAGDRAFVSINDVVTVEDAGSYLGRYRIVFHTAGPLESPTNSYPGQIFFLGGQKVLLASRQPGETLQFGYFDEVPNSKAILRTIDPAGRAADAPMLSSEQPVDAAALLKISRPRPGEYEAPHIQRSAGNADLGALWDGSGLTVAVRFVRYETDPSDKNVWLLTFHRDETLRAKDGGAVPNEFVFRDATVAPWLELGGRYVVFLNRSVGERDSGNYQAVRLWWPKDDFVEQYLKMRSAIGDPANLEDPGRKKAAELNTGALQSPAAEVRRAAALELSRFAALRSAMPADAAASIRARVSTEPSGPAREAMQELLTKIGSK